LKGRKNKEAFTAVESELLKVLKKAGRKGITTKNLSYQMKECRSTATLYKHLKRNITIEKAGRGKWRLKAGPTQLLGPVDSHVTEQLFSHEGLVPATIFEGENPKTPVYGQFEDMLTGHPKEWLDDKEKENWVEKAVSQTYGQPKLLIFFPKHFTGLTFADLDEELLFSDLPSFCDGMLYRMIEWNAKAKKLTISFHSSTEERERWLQQALDFDFLLVMRIDGRKIAAQLKNHPSANTYERKGSGI
jgi:hypothetical protein